MSVHNGHRERMRQEFLSGGLAHFSEPRVLELLLFYSRPRGDVNPLAHQLLETFGSLAGVLDASPTDLAQVPGMGENTVALLKLIPAVAARYLPPAPTRTSSFPTAPACERFSSPISSGREMSFRSWPASTGSSSSWA